jgi:hypothetical protein
MIYRAAHNSINARVAGFGGLGGTRAKCRLIPALILVSIIPLAVGCSPVLRSGQAYQGEQIDFNELLHDHLQKCPAVTVSEAYRVILVLADGEERYDNFASREEALLARGWVRPAWNLRREACINRGSLAYIISRALAIRGGINYNLYGRWLHLGDRRTAVRELEYMGLMNPGPTYQFMSGAEFVFLIGQVDRYMAERGFYEDKPTDIEETVRQLPAGS